MEGHHKECPVYVRIEDRNVGSRECVLVSSGPTCGHVNRSCRYKNLKKSKSQEVRDKVTAIRSKPVGVYMNTPKRCVDVKTMTVLALIFELL